ncbi:LGFP repeat family protein [Mycobacterium xenopi 4042]|uniref:LGFP repeat family protein n=1 Tax=Mycobacterium xenopi 4042 TaxID=1299334 RepID=X8CHD7_MYCXE|nr:LGFP repeat family protein [Mycobacterium xenopi 4042]
MRGAMKAAWDKLGGAKGKLGAPVGDQTVNGDVVSQKFTGGTISWNRATNTYAAEPPSLASSLSGLQAPGQTQPSRPVMPAGGKTTWRWWWLAVVVRRCSWRVCWCRRRCGRVGAGSPLDAPLAGKPPAMLNPAPRIRADHRRPVGD